MVAKYTLIASLVIIALAFVYSLFDRKKKTQHVVNDAGERNVLWCDELALSNEIRSKIIELVITKDEVDNATSLIQVDEETILDLSGFRRVYESDYRSDERNHKLRQKLEEAARSELHERGYKEQHKWFSKLLQSTAPTSCVYKYGIDAMTMIRRLQSEPGYPTPITEREQLTIWLAAQQYYNHKYNMLRLTWYEEYSGILAVVLMVPLAYFLIVNEREMALMLILSKIALLRRDYRRINQKRERIANNHPAALD